MIGKVISIVLLLPLIVPVAAQRELRVAIYPWIPDLSYNNHKNLKQWIENTFEAANPEIDLQVSTPDYDIYDISVLKAHLTDDSTAPHVMEIDTMLLGEVAKKGLIDSLNPETYDLNGEGNYLPFTLTAVTYDDKYYAVPTYICGNFLMGINRCNVNRTCPIEDGVASYDDLNNILNQCKENLMFPPRVRILTGSLEGSWTLPSLYIDAYIDHHDGPEAVYDAMKSEVESQSAVIANMKSFIEFCTSDDCNKCYHGDFGSLSSMVTSIVEDKQTITGYSFSEYIGEYLQYASNNCMEVNVYDIIAPPLGPKNNFLMYTDALVVNKALASSEPTSQKDVETFITFYSKLTTRLSIAFGYDLPEPHPARYLMQARSDFYATELVLADPIYSKLKESLKYAVAAPNHKFYKRRAKMEQAIIDALNIQDNCQCSADDKNCKL